METTITTTTQALASTTTTTETMISTAGTVVAEVASRVTITHRFFRMLQWDLRNSSLKCSTAAPLDSMFSINSRSNNPTTEGNQQLLTTINSGAMVSLVKAPGCRISRKPAGRLDISAVPTKRFKSTYPTVQQMKKKEETMFECL
mmetsp:Transcript_13970/g.38626  ORF Transcript_13970/g.38626 Transcript_13970/m.38626 type:complete len:145 (-) Transcript_13970:560-994(-)